MPRYFLQLSYDGTNYHGWQIQENAHSVQAEIQNALGKVAKIPVEICGAGRTDTGVHARQMFAHFDCETAIEDPGKFIHQLNGILPADIAIQDVFVVDDKAHARFDALSRTYEYYLNRQKDPFLINKAYYFCQQLNLEEMNKAAAILSEYSDFTSFSKTHSGSKTNLCKVDEAIWEETEGGWKFTIKADRFLRNMVRAIVGTLIHIGTGKLTSDDMRKVIEAKDRSGAGYSVPACGLYLVNVEYPTEIRKMENNG